MARDRRSTADEGENPLDLGLDALLEDDAGRGVAAGLGAARKLGGAALDADSFADGPRATALPAGTQPAIAPGLRLPSRAPPRWPGLLVVGAALVLLLIAAALAVSAG